MKNSYYGEFGGQYVAESLMNPLAEVEKEKSNTSSAETKSYKKIC